MEVNCAGCKKALPAGAYGGDLGQDVNIAPGVTARVCHGRSYHVASSPCALKARIAMRRCPGCGAEDTDIGEICSPCKSNIERGRQLQERKPEWWGISTGKLGPYIHDHEAARDQQYPIESLIELLTQAIATGRTLPKRQRPPWKEMSEEEKKERIVPHGRSSLHGDNDDVFFVELSRPQGQALKAFLQQLRHVLWTVYREGFNRGNSLLGRLAKGETSVRDYDRYSGEIAVEIGRQQEEDHK